jgi:hypothetical protein
LAPAWQPDVAQSGVNTLAWISEKFGPNPAAGGGGGGGGGGGEPEGGGDVPSGMRETASSKVSTSQPARANAAAITVVTNRTIAGIPVLTITYLIKPGAPSAVVRWYRFEIGKTRSPSHSCCRYMQTGRPSGALPGESR